MLHHVLTVMLWTRSYLGHRVCKEEAARFSAFRKQFSIFFKNSRTCTYLVWSAAAAPSGVLLFGTASYQYFKTSFISMSSLSIA